MTTANRAILVVEDELLLRLMAVDIVEDAGFEALAAATADEALAIQMPGSMDGLRLAHAVRDRWPPVELVVTSGRCSIGANDLPDRGRFIAKPYDVHALSQVFQEMAGAEG